jgi:predicted NUDIX family NTP pyrophosphohydrolase
MSDTGHSGICWPPSDGAMQEFIHRKNLEKYRQLLAETKDEAQRCQLEKLLAEEVAKEPLVPRPRDDG